jgi:hypothetical protein
MRKAAGTVAGHRSAQPWAKMREVTGLWEGCGGESSRGPEGWMELSSEGRCSGSSLQSKPALHPFPSLGVRV